MSLGNTLRSAREACGFTTSELAARTHMLVQIVEGLENEDFRRIPAPIYGRGFIKLYCEAVNLDPKPLQTEFMDLFSKAKDAPAKMEMPSVQARPQATEQQPVAEVVDETPVAEPAPVEEAPATAQPTEEPPPVESLFELPIQTPNPSPTINLQPPPKRSYGDIFGQSYTAEDESPKPSAAEKFRDTMSNVSSGVFANVQKLPPNTGRIIAVSLCAALILGLIGWGVFELYKATTPGGDADVAPAAITEVAKEKPDVKKPSAKANEVPSKPSPSKSYTSVKPGDLKSSGIEVPALYID